MWMTPHAADAGAWMWPVAGGWSLRSPPAARGLVMRDSHCHFDTSPSDYTSWTAARTSGLVLSGTLAGAHGFRVTRPRQTPVARLSRVPATRRCRAAGSADDLPRRGAQIEPPLPREERATVEDHLASQNRRL